MPESSEPPAPETCSGGDPLGDLLCERDRLRAELSVERCGPWIARSAPMRRVASQVARVASTPRTTVLITGEAGAGKELVARSVHERSERAAGPFATLACERATAERLFGDEPGGRRGRLEEAEGGALFLDEVGDLAPPLQTALLGALQDDVYRRVGGSEELAFDVRILASTERDLERLVAEGGFREDLYYRLNVLSIRVPSLRDRTEDLEDLAAHFLARATRGKGVLTPSAVKLLAQREWPGNVRELRAAVERAAFLAAGSPISPEHVDVFAPEGEIVSPYELPPGDRSLRAVEEHLIRRVLEECEGNRSEAARVLGINRTTLYNKLRRYEPDLAPR